MMKKSLMFFVFLAALFVAVPVLAQDGTNADGMEMSDNDSAQAADSMKQDSIAAAEKAKMEEEAAKEEEEEPAAVPTESESEDSGTRVILDKFVEGGEFMVPVLICLILGLAVCFERILNLNLKTANKKKLLNDIESKLESNDVEAAKDLCRNTRGPIASICYQALDRKDEGVDIVEKSIVSYGSVQMGLLEKGLTWISLFIAIAPMLGFMGTVIGMIQAFDDIEAAGDISPSLVAGGIKIALLTTVAGLIVAIILQIFYNYIVAKIDGLVNDMEDSSISLVDMMLKYNVFPKR